MAHSTTPMHARDDLLLWTLALSLALHGAALALLPGFDFKRAVKIIEPLTVELQQLPPPPVVQPEQPKQPEPPKPAPVKPKLEKAPPKPLPPPVVPLPAPVVSPPQRSEPPPPAVTEPPKPVEPAPPPVIAVEQKPVEPPPAFVAPAATPKAPEPNEDALGEIRAAYGKVLKDEFSRHTRYPAVAALKGWEGRVKIRLQVDKDGNVIGTPEVTESSGYKMLDEDAVKTILKSSPLPLPPAALNVKPIFINTTLDYHKSR